MGRKYANPPIVEAVCEFRLSPDTPWDLTVPGLLYEKLKEEFPHKESRLMQEMEIKKGPGGVQQEVRTSERILLFTKGRKLFVQVGPRLVAINSLSPYPTWADFHPKIERTWQALRNTVEVKGVERIGLRYINRITVPISQPIEEYFAFHPLVGPNLPQKMMSFSVGAEFALHEGRDRCRVQLMTAAPESSETSTLFLDIDYFLARPKGIDLADALAWVDEAHDKVESIFEGCITDRLRELFREVRG